MTISVVQSVEPTSGSGDSTFGASLSGVGAGHAIVAIIGTFSPEFPTGVSDGQGSYTLDFQYGSAPRSIGVSFYSLFNCTAGTHEVTVTGGWSGGGYGIVLAELAGVGTSDSYDLGAGAAGASTGPLTATTGTLSNSGDIAFAAGVVNAAIDGWATPSGWTSFTLQNEGYPSWAASWLLPGTTSALSPSYGDISTATDWAFGIAAYKPGSAPAGAGNQGLLLRGCV